MRILLRCTLSSEFRIRMCCSQAIRGDFILNNKTRHSQYNAYNTAVFGWMCVWVFYSKGRVWLNRQREIIQLVLSTMVFFWNQIAQLRLPYMFWYSRNLWLYFLLFIHRLCILVLSIDDLFSYITTSNVDI